MGKVLIIWAPDGRLMPLDGYSILDSCRKIAAEFDTSERADEFINGKWLGKPRFTEDEKKLCIKVQEID